MTFKNWLILFVVATALYAAVVLVFPKIVDARLRDGASNVRTGPVDQVTERVDERSDEENEVSPLPEPS